MIKHLLEIVYGAVFGIANIIPGVSGGTMMVVFGIYDKLVGALSLNFKEIKKNIVFLIFFGIGAVLGLFGFSFAITFLFDSFPVATYLFFMGLILGSVPLIIKNATVKEKFRPTCLIAFIPALALVIGMSIANGMTTENYSVKYERTDYGMYFVTLENNSSHDIKENWRLKIPCDVSWENNCKIMNTILTETTLTGVEGAEIPAGEKYQISFYSDTSLTENDFSFSFTYKMNFMLFLTLLGGSALAAVAMIIPGVSGSFIFVLLGLYTTIIGAVKALDIMICLPVAFGVIVGVVLGARLISALLKRFRLMVYSAILGLVAGSFFVLFPAGFGLNVSTLIGVFAFIAGAAVSFFSGKNVKASE